MSAFFDFRKQGMPRKRANTTVTGNSTRTKSSTFKRARTPSRKKRTFKRKSRKAPKRGSVQSLNRRVTKIARGLAANQGTLTHRELHVGIFNVPQYQAAFFQQICSSFARLEGTLTDVPMYDSSTAQVVSNDFTVATTQMGFNFERTTITTSIVNNSTAGIVIRAGFMTVNDDTSFGPLAAWNAGLTDASLTSTDPLLKLSDSGVLKDLWHFIPGGAKTMTLSPGGRLNISTSLGQFTYQRATSDADALTYRKDNKPLVLVIHAHGVLQKDTSLAQLNYSQCSVTVESLVTRTIKYAAGADVRRTVTRNVETSTFTNGGAQVNQPEAVLQSFT